MQKLNKRIIRYSNAHKRNLNLLIGFLFIILFANVAYSQTINPIFGWKETSGIGPRAIGMGGAFVAISDDASAAYWNVAGLAQLSSYELSISSAPDYFMDKVNGKPGFGFPWYASFQFIAPLAKENTLGISLFRPFHDQRNLYIGNNFLDQPTSSQFSYLQNPSFQQSEILLSYAARFSAVRNFSVGVNIKRITNDPYYIRYFGNDPSLAKALNNATQVTGFGVDVGILYRIPITKYSEEFRIGLALNDLVGLAQYPNGLTAGSNILYIPPGATPITFNVGPGYQANIPPEITLGFAYKNAYLFKIRNITAIDFDQISDPRFSDSDNKYLRFGTEFWFFRDVMAVRGGYSTPLSRPGIFSLGLSLRAFNGDFQTDAAYLLPVSPSASVTAGSAIGSYDTGGINFENFYIGMAYRFGGGEELPPPKVGAYVQPASFFPAQGEKAEFHLDTTEDVTVNRWSVLIYDKNNHLVRGLRGVGSPTTKLLWSGEDDEYQPLPPGVYTWAFQVQDQLEHIGSTPVQTIEILSSVNEGSIKDSAKLINIRRQQQSLLEQERKKLTTLAQENLKKMLESMELVSNTANAQQKNVNPTDSANNTGYPEAGNVPVMGFNHLNPDQVLNAHFDKNLNGDAIIIINYRSHLTYVPYIFQEAGEVVKTGVNSVGTGLKEISTRVYYGKNELVIITPTQVAANFAVGKINQLQFLQLSDIHINGEKVGPNGY